MYYGILFTILGDEMTPQPLPEQHFQKILVARKSPQNGCFASDGDLLYPPLSDESHAKPGTKYYFRSVVEPNKRSRYGWVKSTDQPFTLQEFLARNLKS